VANLLFILILLLIALGTIFRAESYNIKKSLYKFILIIFLINFSFMIAGLFIDFGNFLMYGVLKIMCTSSGSNTCFVDFFHNLMDVIDTLYNKYPITAMFGGFKTAAAMAIATIYTFIYALILLALGVFLLVRVAALAILLILSPLAFFGYTAPGLEGLKNQWWDNLIKYVMFGPVFALMLYVSGLMMKNTIAVPPAVFNANPNLAGLGGDFAMIITYIIPLIFLIGIIPVTQAFGLIGSGAILGGTTGLGAFVGGFAGSYADRWLARGAHDQRKGALGTLNRARSYLSVGAWKRARKASEAEKEHHYDIAAGRLRENVFEPGAVKHGEDARQREVARQRADVKGKDKGELVHLMTGALDKGMMERAEAIALELGATGDMNEVYTKMKDNEGHFYLNNSSGFNKFMEEKFEPKLGEDKTGRLMSELANLEKKDGNQSFKGTSYFEGGKYKIRRLNHEKEEIRKSEEEKHAEKRAEELGSVESQSGLKNMDSRSLVAPKYERDDKGNIKYWKEEDQEVKNKEKKAGEAKIMEKGGVEQWEFDYGGIAALRKLTEKQIFTAEKAKPKHQARYSIASDLDGNEEKRIREILKDQGAENTEINAVIGKIGRLKNKLNEVFGQTGHEGGSGASGGYDASKDAGAWQNITSAGPSGPGAGPSAGSPSGGGKSKGSGKKSK